MTQPINHYTNLYPRYKRLWVKSKQFPQSLAQGSKNPPLVAGPAAAALISAGIGCFSMMLSHHFAVSDRTKVIDTVLGSLGSWIPGSHNPSKIWGNIGSYSGKETVLLITWLISWFVLHSLWKNKNIKAKTMIFWLLTLMIAATALCWHPLFPYLPLV